MCARNRGCLIRNFERAFLLELTMVFRSAHNFRFSSASSWNMNTGDIRCDIGFSPES